MDGTHLHEVLGHVVSWLGLKGYSSGYAEQMYGWLRVVQEQMAFMLGQAWGVFELELMWEEYEDPMRIMSNVQLNSNLAFSS